MKNKVKKIAVIGPESTGKSALCKALALHFDCLWCPEYAREYLLRNGKEYTFDTLQTIAKGQLRKEDDYMQRSIDGNKSFLFIDTEMYIMKVWYEYAFNQCPYFVLQEIVNRPYDYYLLTNTDLPWEEDELREYPDPASREKLLHTYKDILIHQTSGWQMVSGHGDERTQNAIAAIERIFLEKNDR